MEAAGFAGHIMEIRLSARYQWEGPDSPPFFDQTFADSRITIGNDPAASLCLNGSVLSAEQLVIIDGETEPQVVNQAEGTSLNGETLGLNECRPLKDGDVLSIGTYRISIFLTEAATSNYSSALLSAGSSVARRNGGSNSQFTDDTLEEFLQAPDDNLDGAVATGELAEPLLPASHRVRPSKSFAAILDGLRTDEDRFYFVVEGGEQSGVRISIELEEMPMGWDESGENLCFNISIIADLCAVVRKDWSGVILRSTGPGITVNSELLEDERRLRDGDRLLLKRPRKEGLPDFQVVMVFREPTSLVILDSLMPRVPPLQEDAALPLTESTADGSARLDNHKRGRKLASLIKSDKEYFTVFTFVELTLMAIGTLVGAAIIFLILNSS
jgi:hypothetical protein